MTPCTFSADPLNPSRLRCDVCGESVCALPPGDGPDPARWLTGQQAALRWPDQAGAVREHAVVCVWRRGPGAGVYVHTTEGR